MMKESKKVEKELENEYTKKAIGAQIRSRIKWIEEGEKNTKYFRSVEKSRQTQKSITKIYNKERKIMSNQSDILERQKEFYEDLYKTKHPNTDQIKQFIKETIIESKLNSEDGDKFEGILTEDGCYNAFYKMKLNKSPGSDGLNVEFYREFYTKSKTLLIKSLNEGYEKADSPTHKELVYYH